MGKVTKHVNLTEETVEEIMGLVGKRNFSRFIDEAARERLDRLNFLQATRDAAGSWKRKRHPELKGKDGAARWVEKLRGLDNRRLEELLKI